MDNDGARRAPILLATAAPSRGEKPYRDNPLSMKQLLKAIWRKTPKRARELALQILCGLSLDKAGTFPGPAVGPFFIVGNHRALSGLARGARLYADELRASGVEAICVDSTSEMLQTPYYSFADVGAVPLAKARELMGPGTVVLHLNPPQFQLALLRLDRNFLRGKRIQAYWAWELEEIPRVWRHALNFVHEVFVPSIFVREAVSRHTAKPVVVVAHPVPVPEQTKDTFMADGVLRCLFIFDTASLALRKNPGAVIEAFRQAFAPGEASLTLKIGQPEADRSAVSELAAAAARTPGVTLTTVSLDEQGLDALYRAHDVYISLHRSEGYGLTIREAMVRGLFIVATGWSGNMDFMRGEKCFPVPYRLTAVQGVVSGLDGARCRWAEPDVVATSSILRAIRTRLLEAGTPAPGATGRTP